MALEIGDVIDGKYKIIRLLGEGGMGSVFEGENTRIHRRVAIKVLHGEVAANQEVMTRFEREAQAAGRIGSEHIVEVLDMGDLRGGERYMVMEYLEGEPLSDRIGRGQMPPRAIGTLMVDILEGLKAAHHVGIVHRDLKPDNVFLVASRSGKKDFVKIVDFGISKFNSLGGEFSMTRTGAVMGTPYYMAPEQAKGGKTVDHRVDIYALGVILYQAVVGRVPFQAETFNELLFKIVLETPAPLGDQVPGIDTDFVDIVSKAMNRDPEARYQTADEFQNALMTWLGGRHLEDKTVRDGTPVNIEATLLSGSKSPSEHEIRAESRLSHASILNAETTGAATSGNWESEATSIPGHSGSRKKLLIGAGAAAAVFVGLIFFVSSREDEHVASQPTLETEKKTSEPDLKQGNEIAEAQADAAKIAAEAKAHEKSVVAAQEAKGEQGVAGGAKQEERPSLSRSIDSRASTTKAPTRAASSTPVRAAPSAAPPVSPAPAPSPKPAPAPAVGKSGGRIITTDL